MASHLAGARRGRKRRRFAAAGRLVARWDVSSQTLQAAVAQTLVLLLEDAPRHFEAAGLAVERLRARLDRDELLLIDLVYAPPSVFICLLHLSSRAVAAGA